MNRSMAWLADELRMLDEQDLLRQRRQTVRRQGCHIVVDGKQYVNFASNDYLNFATDPHIVESVGTALRANGWGAGASPLVTGRSALHSELERRLATFEQTEAALVFTSGFAANVGTIDALVGKRDTIFSDERNHASIIDGCRLSKANTVVYPHCDTDGLERRLERTPATGRRLIVTDSLFSMDGDMAPLPRLCELAKRYDAMLMVDEAHATGVYGVSGSGCAELMGCSKEIDVHVGTLSKAFGSQGGFVAGSQELIDWLFHRARSYVFSTAPPPALCAAALTALDLIRDEPQRRHHLLAQASDLRTQLKKRGWSMGNSTGQIIPIVLGEPNLTMQWSAQLAERGFLVPGIRPPTVPHGGSMLRISLTSAHDAETLKRFVESLDDLRRHTS